jgi:hypothetical protein
VPWLGEVHLETAARLDSAFAAFARGYASQFGDESLDHATCLGVLRRHSSKRAAVAPDDDAPVTILELRKTAQLIQHGNCLL